MSPVEGSNAATVVGALIIACAVAAATFECVRLHEVDRFLRRVKSRVDPHIRSAMRSTSLPTFAIVDSIQDLQPSKVRREHRVRRMPGVDQYGHVKRQETLLLYATELEWQVKLMKVLAAVGSAAYAVLSATVLPLGIATVWNLTGGDDTGDYYIRAWHALCASLLALLLGLAFVISPGVAAAWATRRSRSLQLHRAAVEAQLSRRRKD